MFKALAKLFAPKPEVDSAWLIAEKAKHRYSVVIVLNDGSEKEMGPCEPYEIQGDYGIQMTSYYLAKIRLERSYERRFFRDDDDQTYPTHAIIRAFVR